MYILNNFGNMMGDPGRNYYNTRIQAEEIGGPINCEQVQ